MGDLTGFDFLANPLRVCPWSLLFQLDSWNSSRGGHRYLQFNDRTFQDRLSVDVPVNCSKYYQGSSAIPRCVLTAEAAVPPPPRPARHILDHRNTLLDE